MASKSRKTNRRKASGFDVAQAEHETYSVDALPTETSEKDLRALLKPARSLAGDAKHYEKLDGAMDAAFAGGIVPKVEWSAISSFVSFVGYGVLQQLSQDALIRLCIQTRTDEMLRSWIDIKCDDEERKKKLESEIARLGLRETLSKALTTMGLMGGAFLYIDTGSERPFDVLNKTPKSIEFKKGIAFRVIAPIFTTPQGFNASEPLKDDFYKPSVFFIMGQAVHTSRLIRFVENEVPDLLKPAYNFFGIPQAQLLSDYVTHFRKNREEVNQLLHKFSTSFIKTDLGAQLFAGKAWGPVSDRVRFFAKFRDNSGVGLLDKEKEDFVQVNTPITGLTDIARQSLEFVVSINQSGVVKTLGYSPQGFNATGESDIKLQADLIATRQEKILRKPIEEILRLLQLELFGDIDSDLTFDFNPLDEDDERTTAEVEKLKADTAAVYLDRGVLAEDEVRESLRTDDRQPYGDLEGEAPGMAEDPFAQMTDPTQGQGNGEIF
jgi:phage-related protein (TIGR01555 family)